MTTSARLRRDRGVTLVELLVALAISSIVLASLFGVVQSQQNAYFQGHLQRAAQGNARAGLAYVEQRLGIAGYGMDAPLAFDFQYYGFTDPMPCPALAAGCPRDSVNGNDELVFYARDPRYWVPEDRSGAPLPSGNAWRVLSLTSTALTVAPKPGDKFEKGRIVQLVCKDGSKYLYATVARNVPTIGTPAPVSESIPLAPPVASNPFRRQDLTTLGDCFNSGNARAFFIDRYRFHVRPVQVGRDYRPYLVLDRGLDENNDGPDEAEEIVVAEGIESFQVGYVLTATSKDWPARGTVAGVPITFAAGAPGSTAGNAMTTLQFPGVVNPGQWTYQPSSFYRYAVGPTPAIADERRTDHQANIRGVRLAIVARGPEPDPARARTEVLLPILNQNALPAWDVTQNPYSRARVETTVPVRNMTTRAMNDF